MSLRALRPIASLAAVLVAAACNFSVKSTASETDSDSGSSGSTTTSQECGPQTNTDDDCACLDGYSRCDPESGAIACCPQCPDPHSEPLGDDCFCVLGWAWCDDQPGTCCPIEGTSSEPTTTTTVTTTIEGTTTEAIETTGETTAVSGSTTTGGEECPGAQLPPNSCNPGQESFWCTQPESCGPEGGEVYRCVGDEWVLDVSLAEENCNFDGFDFAYGCVDDGNKVEFVCGDGPGTPCDNADPAACVGDAALQQCLYGKLSEFDCLVQCTEIGDENGVLYDHGSCGEQDGRTACLCCDQGDAGCPI